MQKSDNKGNHNERQDTTSGERHRDATGVRNGSRPNSEGTGDATRFWDTIRRAEASFHRQDRASQRFHEAKRRVDQTLRRLSDANEEDCAVQGRQHRLHFPDDDDDEESFAGQEQVQDQNLDLPGFINAYGGEETRDIKDIATSGGDAEFTRQGEAQGEIAPIIDAMESRAARVEQLVEEMEWLLIDVQRLLDGENLNVDTDHNVPSSRSRSR
ncbi:hypothetical protein F5887DRAFT_163951 [Amanita rubescens]|nr:hypothetical protein F5887DRAFT_163951 [Amanita rubescens]